MLNLTFGEQVKIVLNRKGMTIKELAEQIEAQTGKKMSRQNMTQRLGRDNFQEQDMRMIADILGCPFRLSILAGEDTQEKAADADTLTEKEIENTRRKKSKSKTIFLTPNENQPEETEKLPEGERDMTIGELVEIHEELDKLEEKAQVQELEEAATEEVHTEQQNQNTGNVGVTRPFHVIREYIKKPAQANEKPQEAEQKATAFREELQQTEQQKVERAVRKVKVIHNEEERSVGEINPYTGKEYETNSVRVHPSRIGYVQVYNREDGQWTDMTEWAFLGYQERMKTILGKAYVPPIYLD